MLTSYAVVFNLTSHLATRPAPTTPNNPTTRLSRVRQRPSFSPLFLSTPPFPRNETHAEPPRVRSSDARHRCQNGNLCVAHNGGSPEYRTRCGRYIAERTSEMVWGVAQTRTPQRGQSEKSNASSATWCVVIVYIYFVITTQRTQVRARARVSSPMSMVMRAALVRFGDIHLRLSTASAQQHTTINV